MGTSVVLWVLLALVNVVWWSRQRSTEQPSITLFGGDLIRFERIALVILFILMYNGTMNVLSLQVLDRGFLAFTVAIMVEVLLLLMLLYAAFMKPRKLPIET